MSRRTQARAPWPAECGGARSDIAYGPGTNLPGRSDPGPLQGPADRIIQNGQPVEIDGPPGAFRTLGSGSTMTVGDRYFGDPNVVKPQGATLNYQFLGSEEHNVTLANGPMGIGSPTARARPPTPRPSPGPAPTASSASCTRRR